MYCQEIMDYVVRFSGLIARSEVPVFAAVAIESMIISTSQNQVESRNRSWLHAEFIAVEKACNILNTRYLDMASIYINLEPCAFCAAALEKVRIKEIFFGAYDPKCGAIEHNSRIFDYSMVKTNIIGGIQESKCSDVIVKFFKELRKLP